MTRQEMKEAWAAFDAGDMLRISDETIKAMLAEAEAAREYLKGRGESFFISRIVWDVNHLSEILRMREAIQERRVNCTSKAEDDSAWLDGLADRVLETTKPSK